MPCVVGPLTLTPLASPAHLPTQADASACARQTHFELKSFLGGRSEIVQPSSVWTPIAMRSCSSSRGVCINQPGNTFLAPKLLGPPLGGPSQLGAPHSPSTAQATRCALALFCGPPPISVAQVRCCLWVLGHRPLLFHISAPALTQKQGISYVMRSGT